MHRFVFNSVVHTHAPKCTLGPSIKNLLETELVDYTLVHTFVYYSMMMIILKSVITKYIGQLDPVYNHVKQFAVQQSKRGGHCSFFACDLDQSVPAVDNRFK